MVGSHTNQVTRVDLPFWKRGKFKKNLALTTMVLPGLLWLLILRYLPMGGIILAFKKYSITKGGFIPSLLNSQWVGFKNFEFLFTSSDTLVIVRNTLGYNLLWMVLGLVLAVSFAIMLSEIRAKFVAKAYQTMMFFPHFLSWVVAGYFVYAFLSTDRGLINGMLKSMGHAKFDWYMTPGPWPTILTIAALWKGTGYSSVLYLAAITGIDKTLYEAAMIDGASKWKQIVHVTLPGLKTMIIILSIMSVGRIFNADFGLFYNVPRNSGALFQVTQVVDTYVYRAMSTMQRLEMATAAGLFQSAIGFVLILTANTIVTRIDNDSALF